MRDRRAPRGGERQAARREVQAELLEASPRVLNRRRDGIPEGAVYVGRPTKWGNPFREGPNGTRAYVVAKYRAYLEDAPAIREAAHLELRGRDLVCWCAPLPCHADVLLDVANSRDTVEGHDENSAPGAEFPVRDTEEPCPGCLDCSQASLLAGSVLDRTPRCEAPRDD